MKRPPMPRDWYRRMLPEGTPRPAMELYETPLELRYSATRELLDTQATVEACAEAWAVSGSEEVLGMLIAAMRQHRRAMVSYVEAFEPSQPYRVQVHDDTMS